MGCDIHLSVEKYDSKSKKWKHVPGLMRECWGCKGTGKDKKKKEDYEDDDGTKIKAGDCYWCRGEGKRREDFYGNRNYDTFAILADVRNGHGFAGVPTGDGFNPIDNPRGVPEDASPEYRKRVADYGGDGHSHSYFTVAELDAYDWNQKTGHQGVVTPSIYKAWVDGGKNGAPASYSGGVGGPNVVHVSNKEMEELIENGTAPVKNLKELGPYVLGEDAMDGKSYYTTVRWTELYSESAEDFLEALKEIRELGKPDEVRICFYFDN